MLNVKAITKQLDYPVMTVAHIFQKFKIHANLPGGGHKRKIDDKLKTWMATKEPRTTYKEKSVRKLGLSHRTWVFQQDNDPHSCQHTTKSTQEWLRTQD